MPAKSCGTSLAESDPAGFAHAVATQVDGAARKASTAVQEVLTRTLGAAPSSADTLFFWRNFVVGRMETTAQLGIDRLRAIDLLSQIAPPDGANPTQLFAVLEALARQLNVHAAHVDRETLVSFAAGALWNTSIAFARRPSRCIGNRPPRCGAGA